MTSSTDIWPRTLSPSEKEVSVIPCTQEDTFCFINWSERRVTVKSGAVGFCYPFSKCSIRSMWEERSSPPDITVRRAVLVLRGFSYWTYTLAPECPGELSRLASELNSSHIPTRPIQSRPLSEEELKLLIDRYSQSSIIQRANLGPLTSGFLLQFFEGQQPPLSSNGTERKSQSQREANDSWRDIETNLTQLMSGKPWIEMKDIPNLTNNSNRREEVSQFKEMVCCSPRPPVETKIDEDKSTTQWNTEQISLEKVRRLQKGGTAAVESNLIQPLADFTGRLVDMFGEVWESCTERGTKPKFAVHAVSADAADLTFGHGVLWAEEPILPIQMYLVRHGQQLASRSCGVEYSTPLSQLGKIQSIRTSELLHQWTRGFVGSRTLGVLSSQLQRSEETADLIWHALKMLGGDIDGCSRISHPQLGEFLPIHSYRLEDADLKKEIDRDVKSQDDAYWMLSAAVRGLKGPLIPQQKGNEYRPTDLCEDGIHLLGTQAVVPHIHLPSLCADLPASVVQRYRFPALEVNGHQTIWGKLLNPEVTSPIEEGRSVNLIVSGHGNTIKNFIIKEIGFPKLLWRNLQLPHCSVVLLGLHHSGRPALLIADAGYLSIPLHGEPLPMSFTPFVQSESIEGLSHKDKLATDQMVTLLPAEDSQWWSGIAGHPSIRYDIPKEQSKKEKQIILLRAGHNMVVNSRDSGLTEIGVKQLEMAAEWLGLFLMSGRIIDAPRMWCTAGLTSDWTSVDITLKESLVIVKEKFKQHLGAETHNPSLLPSQVALYPENLFAAPSADGYLHVIVADDYHLLKYFGACFGIDPSRLQQTYWPHAGHILITITESGCPELRTFGTISHLHPSQISILPAQEPVDNNAHQIPNKPTDSTKLSNSFRSAKPLVDLTPSRMMMQPGSPQSVGSSPRITSPRLSRELTESRCPTMFSPRTSSLDSKTAMSEFPRQAGEEFSDRGNGEEELSMSDARSNGAEHFGPSSSQSWKKPNHLSVDQESVLTDELSESKFFSPESGALHEIGSKGHFDPSSPFFTPDSHLDKITEIPEIHGVRRQISNERSSSEALNGA